jgi:hypothetical protein
MRENTVQDGVLEIGLPAKWSNTSQGRGRDKPCPYKNLVL